MRVTRVIREYVEKEIRIKAEAKRKEISNEYDTHREACLTELAEYMDTVNEVTVYPQVSMILRKHGMDAVTEEGFMNYAKTFRRNVPVGNKEKNDKIWKTREELRKKEREAVQNLLIDLELGANKDELKEMLESIEF